MLTMNRIEEWRDHDVVGIHGHKIGTIADVYYDDDSGRPEWLLVERGLLGRSESFVPLHGASVDGDAIRVAYPKDVVKEAPDVDADGYLSEAQELRLFEYYGIAPDGVPAATGDDTGAEVTLAEERLDLGTIRRPRELVRLRKDVRTEHVTKTVPVRHEEIHVERVPLTGDATVADAGEEVTMEAYDEEPVVEKRAEAKERVKLEKDVRVDQERVEADLRKEEVDIDRSKP